MTGHPHPLDPATAGEYLAGRRIMVAAGLLADPVRFAYYGLEEPSKEEVLAGASQPGAADRRLRAFLLNLKTGESADVVVSLTQGSVVSARVIDTAAEGQLPIVDSEFHLVEEIVAADPQWQAAMARRGLTDMSKIRICPITAGAYRAPAEDDARRMVRVLAFLQEGEHDLAWAHPVDGVTAHVDLIEKKVLRVTDEFVLPVPRESGDYDDPAVRGPERAGLRPVEITQPEGPSFTVDGGLLRWQDWSLRVGFDAREGLTLHQIELAGRPVIYRASVPEMVVPYGDPRFRYWQAYFDTGEYLVGKWVNSLELGCDCLGEITYLDAVICGETGEPREVRNAICIHEEDFGILWKHTDIFNGSAQSRRQRRLVVSFFTTVGNYDYGFYWYFYLDGTIECEVKMTGVVFTAGHPGGEYPYSTEVAPGLGAPVHQHLFSARLDMSVDGQANAVEEVDVHGLPVGPDNPFGNAIAQTVTRLTSEASAARPGDASRGRVWRVVSTERTNRFGRPTAFTLCPQPHPALLAHPDSPLAARAGFATRALWVTRYDPAQRYPAGDFVNQSPGGGLPAYAAADRDIDGQDIVVWHTFGPTHVVRTEDWPVMPVARTGFMLRPTGFFDRNPTLNVPAPPGHCHAG
ncbi:primary-amine oxidase [Trebonia kvetii]|uniref:Amine oxidase n=1 Tax=Trebonia kvetii TaxID=2480626 RepID=A0A6P2C5M9_9ACTN|nr:primary-amine oxidase [Trebonia kvetii]TVZ05676.1 primary-amine oxidase [Trebonia kvetii]